LRPAVRGQTNRYNGKIKLGRGFTLRELREAGIKGVEYARSLGIAVDLRRKDTSNETLKLNSGRVKDYISRMILYPRSKGQYEKKPVVAEKVQNTLKHVLPLPKPEVGYSWANITKEMKEANAFKIQRTELKTTKGFYKRLEEAKKKATSGKK
jgi:large subunit ribosomal protein L13e